MSKIIYDESAEVDNHDEHAIVTDLFEVADEYAVVCLEKSATKKSNVRCYVRGSRRGAFLMMRAILKLSKANFGSELLLQLISILVDDIEKDNSEIGEQFRLQLLDRLRR